MEGAVVACLVTMAIKSIVKQTFEVNQSILNVSCSLVSGVVFVCPNSEDYCLIFQPLNTVKI